MHVCMAACLYEHFGWLAVCSKKEEITVIRVEQNSAG